ncbi:MAG TPA: hypothetical protein PLE19_11825 [Planctomycetota bacterium]|nr:hypothetical protein [Planctomycetota bacterium]HRT96649.1 hypothetical protein [Planctomycetota bacterium]
MPEMGAQPSHPPEGLPVELPGPLPFIWPEPRVHAGIARYETMPPFEHLLAEADLISGVLVGLAEKTVEWLDALMHQGRPRKVSLVLVVYPACPTRERHLLSVKKIQDSLKGPEHELSVRVLPVPRSFGDDCEKMVLPPTVLQAHATGSGRTVLCIGSVGDAGRDESYCASFNVVFQPDDALRDAWRRWFQWLLSSSAPLRLETARIPHLVPAAGDLKAAEMWQAFESACRGPEADQDARPTVDPVTGEVTREADGTEVKRWDGGQTALDPLARKLQEVYAQGHLVTVDETTRIKPVAIPVKATLLGQQSERTVGALKQKQSFTLQILDEVAAKEVEKCRKVTDLLDLFSYPLSLGNRWIPEAAQSLLEAELNARNKKGQATLKAALGGCEIPAFIGRRSKAIRADLDAMYQQLGQGATVPDDRFQAVLGQVESRLTAALSARITPRAVYSRIVPPDLTASARSENWSQPFLLLLRAARLMREALTDGYFPRRFSGLNVTEAELLPAMDVFADSIVQTRDSRRAREELSALEEIEDGPATAQAKCSAVWQIIRGQVGTP